MPTFSIVVSAYNNARYLRACLESVASQTASGWECIVVDDASTDETRDVAKSYVSLDTRFSVIELPENGGLHRSRQAGVSRCSKDYVVFLDADDELFSDAIEQLSKELDGSPVDILHFGIEVVPCGVDDDACEAFARFVNGALGELSSTELCKAVFTSEGGYAQDWRVTQRAYDTSFAQGAFASMTSSRLERSEDCYEFLVLASRADTQRTANDVRALRYFYGRGVTGESEIDVPTFERFSSQFQACIKAMEELSGSEPRLRRFVEGGREKLYDLLMNDWLVRVGDDAKLEAARLAVGHVGLWPVASQLMRLVRDKAYDMWTSGAMLTGLERFVEWYQLADSLAARSECPPPAQFERNQTAAENHLRDLQLRSNPVDIPTERVYPARSATWVRQKVRIFVTTHKDVRLFDSDILQPVQVGFARPRKRFLWALQDDSGDNISDLNAMYCELTTQYWAWKNANADYLGFCHYRRYFDFSMTEHEENPYGEVVDETIDWDSQQRYGLDDKTISAAVEGYDVITTGIKDLRLFPEQYESPVDHYARAPYLHLEDLRRVMEILCEMHPDYAEDVDAFLDGHVSCFCNMFIMRRELFSRYCDWLFPILERFVDGWGTTHLSREALRTPGHLSERLLNVFLIHEKRVNPGLRHKEVQCVHFEHPERVARAGLDPVDGGGLPVVPVALAADNNYVPMLATTVYSMLKNASSASFYDVVVLEKDIAPRNKALMKEFFSRFSNASLRFVDVAPIVASFNLKTSNAHISTETYYRFLIQQILPFYDKVLYLDSDLIVEGDVAELFASDLGDNLIGAVIDVDYLGNLNMNDGRRMAYTREVLGLADPYGYFQAGVLVLNTAALRQLHSVEEWLGIAAEPKYIYDDQDILNACCQGRVIYLDPSWNVMNDCSNRIANVFSFAPARVFDAFKASYADARIMHYAGCEKPWKPGPCDRRELYWSYARETPFYEQLLSMLATVPVVVDRPAPHERAISENNPVRRVLDLCMPLGSRRREAVKALVRGMRGRR